MILKFSICNDSPSLIYWEVVRVPCMQGLLSLQNVENSGCLLGKNFQYYNATSSI